MGIESITPTPGTPTASICGVKKKIDGKMMWLKGSSPTLDDESRSPYHERAAYLISEMLGMKLVPLTILVLEDGKVASAMRWVRGCRSYDTRVSAESESMMRAFDYIIANTDRHGGNWMVKPSGIVWAIDNAYSFRANDPYYPYKTKLSRKIRRIIRHVISDPAYFYEQLTPLLSQAEIDAVIKRMKRILKK
jgi:hypothetical protein